MTRLVISSFLAVIMVTQINADIIKAKDANSQTNKALHDLFMNDKNRSKSLVTCLNSINEQIAQNTADGRFYMEVNIDMCIPYYFNKNVNNTEKSVDFVQIYNYLLKILTESGYKTSIVQNNNIEGGKAIAISW